MTRAIVKLTIVSIGTEVKMEKYKLRDFAKWLVKQRLTDLDLNRVVDEMEKGLLGDRLGAHVYKKRVPLSGRGKRGGARCIVLYKKGNLVLFIYGYAKNEKSDLSSQEAVQLRIFSKAFFKLSKQERLKKCGQGALIRIEDE